MSSIQPISHQKRASAGHTRDLEAAFEVQMSDRERKQLEENAREAIRAGDPGANVLPYDPLDSTRALDESVRAIDAANDSRRASLDVLRAAGLHGSSFSPHRDPPVAGIIEAMKTDPQQDPTDVNGLR